MAENQNRDWRVIEEQFQTIERNFHLHANLVLQSISEF